MADNKMEKSIKEAIGKSLNEFNKRIGMAKLIKDNKNQDRILKGILSQVNDENIEKTEKSNVITLDNSTDGIVELQEIKGDTNVNVSKMEKETPITHVIDDKNGNVISLDGITEGAINIDDIQGNTMVNCNKDTDKELILMPNLDTNGYSNVTLTQGIDGGKVDVSLEGNTMVNVCDQEDPVAITKSYTVETGNHVALQGEYDGKCRPNIYGNTLVNLADTIETNGANNIINRYDIYLKYIKDNCDYTVIFNANFDSSNTTEMGWLNHATSNWEGKLPNNTVVKGFNKIKITSSITDCHLRIKLTDINSFEISHVVILEGDYTNKPIPDYFTGMKSSFEDKLITDKNDANNGKYKVDYKVTGKNKIAFTELGDILNKAGEDASSTTIMRTSYIFLKANHTYYITNPEVEGSEWFSNIRYDKNKNFIGETYENNETITPKEDIYLRIKKHNPNQLPWNIQLEEGTTATTYEPYKESIKTLYLNSPLLEGDTIEQSGNNIIHNHRYKEVIFDGSEDENWTYWSNNTDTGGLDSSLISFYLTDNNHKEGTLINDKFPTHTTIWGTDREKMALNRDETISFQIACLRSRLTTQNVAGFKQYLQQNPITVVYELATPTQEIISTNDNLLLDSYTNGHLDVDTVVPIDKVVFKGNFNTSLKYLYPNTEYTIQFESDNIGKIDRLHLGGTNSDTLNVTKGINKYTITTGELSSKSIIINGIGFNASKIVVTPKVDNDFGYFKGMKSVGECEDNKIEILSSNKNLLLPSAKDGKIPVFLKKGTRMTLSTKDNALSNGGNVKMYDANDKVVWFAIDEGQTSVEKKLPTDIYYIRDALSYNVDYELKYQLEIGDTATSYIEPKQNKKEILLNKPLRGLPNGVCDKYVIIDDKWYIERNCNQLNGSELKFSGDTNDTMKVLLLDDSKPIAISNIFSNSKDYLVTTKGQMFVQEREGGLTYIWIPTDSMSNEEFKRFLNEKNAIIIYQLATPTYEPIDYNPFEVYTDITHISNNSTIPCNMVIRNNGFNCILKPNTTYTVSSNNGLSTVTTKDSIGDSILRFYDKDTTSITKMNNVLVLEGDYITSNPPIPAFFKGMESAFEQELVTDETSEYYGKYKVNVKAVGKNLFDINKIIKGQKANGTINGNYSCSQFIRVIPNNTYYLKNHNGYRFDGIVQYSQDKVDLNSNIGFTRDASEFVTSNKCYYIKVQIFNSTWTDFKCNVQLEQGDTATEYEPYKENNITFYLNEPLRGVGDIKDKVYVKEDKVVVERNCIEFPLESTQFPSVSIRGNTGLFMYNIPTNNPIVNNNRGKVVCNNFPCDVENAHSRKYPNTISTVVDSSVPNGVIRIITDKNADTIKQWLQNNPTTVVYQLATPVYEEVEYSNNRLTLNTYDNSTLIYDSNIPVSNTSFKPLWEELIYIKNSTTYYIQFNAVGNGNVVVNLGGTELTTTITEGYNKIEITTPNNSTNLLTIDGQGIKISKVVVSEALCSGYYKGLQSCFEEHMENGKYVCVIRGISLDGNKVNGIKFYLNEPLRGIGDIKDKLCIKDNKLMVERNCEEVILDGSDSDINLKIGGIDGNTGKTWFNYEITNKNIINEYASLVECNIYNSNPMNSHNRTENNTIGGVYQQNMACIRIVTEDFNKLQDFKDYLKQNQVKVVYKLQTPVYEEVTNEYGLPIILEGYENGIVYVDSAVTPTTSIKYTSNNTVPTTLSNVDNLNTTTQDDINNNIVTYMMDIDMMLTEMEMDDSASSVMSLSDSDDNNQNHDSSHNNILDRMNKEDRIKYQDNTTKMLEKVIKGKSLTKEENINRIDLYLSEGKIRKEQSNYLKELLKGVE